MCLILFAYDYHPQYKLVVAQNRDEFYNRPTAPAAFWPDNPSILAGRDQQEGGTWMGLTRTGRFATLTNYRDPLHNHPNAPSRGHLVQQYLEADLAPERYLEILHSRDIEYNGFNLLAGTFDSLYYFSNREKLIRQVEQGIHGLSNSLIDVPWPKVTRGITVLTDCLQNYEVEPQQLFAIMTDKEQPDDRELPQTGVSLAWERLLAPVYVESPDYGTKSTTILLIDRDNYVQFWERSFNPFRTGTWNEVHYEFQVNF